MQLKTLYTAKFILKGKKKLNIHDLYNICGKKVCNGGVACTLLQLGSLEKIVIASIFHSGLHSGTIVEKMKPFVKLVGDRLFHYFYKKGPN